MRTTNTEVKCGTQTIYVDAERFESPMELLNYTDKCKCHFERDHDTLSDDYHTRERWYGFTSGKKLKDDFIHSRVDPSKLKMVAQNVKLGGVKTKTEYFNSVVGFAPVVPLVLMGVPANMRNCRTVQHKQKILDVYVNVSASGGIGAEELKEVTTKLIEDVMALEGEGYRLNVYGVWCTTGEDEDNQHIQRVACVSVKLKDAGQPVDLGRVVYPFATSGFHRGICHGWYRRTNVIRGRMLGMGSSICYSRNSEIRKAVVPLLFGKNAIFIGTADYLSGKSIKDFSEVEL